MTEILEDLTQYWAVGSATIANKDLTKFYIENNIWEDVQAKNGNSDNKPILDQIKKGDYLLMHVSTAKGKEPSRTKCKLKAIGKVIGRVKDNYYTFFVSWDVKDPSTLPKEFNDIWYSKNIESMKADEMLRYARKMIRS